MTPFFRVMRAATIVLCLLGLIAYFALPPNQDGRIIINRDAEKAFSEILPNAGANASEEQRAEREAITLENGSIITPIDAAVFRDILSASHKKAQFVMFYASWCPHCKRLFTALNELQSGSEHMNVVTISIDNKPEATQAFISQFTPMRLDSYIMKNSREFTRIGDGLRAMTLNFKGGQGRSMGVPYNVVFYQGQPVAEIAGAIPEDNLKKLVADINKHVKSTTN